MCITYGSFVMDITILFKSNIPDKTINAIDRTILVFRDRLIVNLQ